MSINFFDEFLKRHKLSLSDFYNAQGEPLRVYRPIMQDLNLHFAYNTNECEECGNTLRERQGKCIVCKTVLISFRKRQMTSGYVYIACNIAKQMTKVGMTTEDVSVRIDKFNKRIGKGAEWVAVFAMKFNNAYSIESLVQKRLKGYLAIGEYYDGTESKEMFRCSFQKAKEALENVIKETGVEILEVKTLRTNTEKYKFRNLKRL